MYRPCMKRSIITLVAILTPSSAFANTPDLCTKEVHVNEQNEPYIDSLGVTLSVHCEWTGPGAPVWDDDVCCSFDAAGASCVVPESDAAYNLNMDRYYCEYGEPFPDGGMICYQQFDSACEAGHCVDPEVPGIQAPAGSTEQMICCIGGICRPWDNGWTCEGEWFFCQDGYSKVDGTVECFD